MSGEEARDNVGNFVRCGNAVSDGSPSGVYLRTNDAGLPPARVEVAMRPRDRAALIREQIESQFKLARQKELDHHWDDQIDASHCLFLACITHSPLCLECLSNCTCFLCVAVVQVYTSFVCLFCAFPFRRGSPATTT